MTDQADDVAARWLRGVLEACVVGILRGGPAYGYEIAGRIADAGFVRPKGGRLYPILGRLEANGLVEPSWLEGDGGPSRKYYRLTAAGEDAAGERPRRLPRARDEPHAPPDPDPPRGGRRHRAGARDDRIRRGSGHRQPATRGPLGVLYVLIPLQRWWHADRVVGRRMDEWRRPGWKSVVSMILLLAAVMLAPSVLAWAGVLSEAPALEIQVPRNFALGLLGLAVVAAILGWRLLVKWTTVTVPGDPWYLRNLGNRFRSPW